jgi:hypothetical protein
VIVPKPKTDKQSETDFTLASEDNLKLFVSSFLSFKACYA